jgi:hypothetical protein
MPFGGNGPIGLRYSTLHLLDNLENGLVQRAALLQSCDLCHDFLGSILLQDLCQFNRLIVTFDVLELECCFDGTEKMLDLLTLLPVTTN